jgi:hypothetical protein
MKFNAEQLTEYLNMEAQYKYLTKHFHDLNAQGLSEADYEDLCRRYAYATIQMIKMRSFVQGPSYGQTRQA